MPPKPAAVAISPQLAAQQSEPRFVQTVVMMLLIARLLAAVFLPIADCDETYNYWEPAHFLSFGYGKQTWEYSPDFALRSWLFVWIYALPGFVAGRALPVLLPFLQGTLLTDKLLIYYSSRCIAACFSVALELYFLVGVRRRFGDRVARIAMLMLFSAAGMANSAASFLPSTYAMYCAFAAGGAILRLETARRNLDEARRVEALTASPADSSSSSSATAATPTSNSNSGANNNHTATIVKEQAQLMINLNSVRCVWAAVLGAVVGWPFAALSMLPFALTVLAHSRPFFTFPLREAGVAVIGCSVAVSILDGIFYCKTDGIFSTWNLVKYNVLAGADEGRGPELYGVEPWYFFFKNLLLNFNLVFVMCLVSCLVSALRVLSHLARRVIASPSSSTSDSSAIVVSQRLHQRQIQYSKDVSNLIVAAPFALWFVFWMRVPHKEERFMVPVYPFLVLPAAVLLGEMWDASLDDSKPSTDKQQQQQQQAQRTMKKSSWLRVLCSFLATVIIVLGVSRSVALWRYYGEPDRAAAWLYRHIEQHSSESSRVNVCVGKEWFRYPPAYFLPQNARLLFVESKSFNGALPRDFVEGSGLNGTCTTEGRMNDLNRAEPGQAIPRELVRARCDYIFDTTLGDGGEEMRSAAESDDGSAKRPLRGAGGDGKKKVGYRILRTGEMLDASKTPAWARVLYVPVWSEKVGSWAQVVVAEVEH